VLTYDPRGIGHSIREDATQDVTPVHGPARIVVAAGATSKGQLAHRSAVALADRTTLMLPATMMSRARLRSRTAATRSPASPPPVRPS
jgi:hypothetical protein